jgi:fatty-acyl-CoA synthase
MMDVPLTVTAIMRHGTTAYASSEVVTITTGGLRRQTYGATGVRVARLAHALRSLGVDGDQRVATLMWNNAEHLEAYLAIPSMGAVLHTLNLRLDPQVIGYIADHAGDDVVIVDPTLVPLLAQVLPHHRHRRRGRDRLRAAGRAGRARPSRAFLRGAPGRAAGQL